MSDSLRIINGEVLRATVVLDSGGNIQGSYQAMPSDSLTRPSDTNTYQSGDIVTNTTSAGAVTVAGNGILALTAARTQAGSFIVRKLRMIKSTPLLTFASFRVHLFSTPPTVAYGDNGLLGMTGVAGYLGAADMTFDQAFYDGAHAATMMLNDFNITLSSGQSVYAVLEARGAYAPGSSEVFTLIAEVFQS
jgi:hypothetical protein